MSEHKKNKHPLAAVLVPIVMHQDELTIILTQRTKHLKNHPGQISFPGGSFDKQDLNLPTTALRETFEEIGIDERHITLIGELPQIKTISGNGFLVTPYVGVINPPPKFKINPEEVDDVFEIPLHYILELTHYKKESRLYKNAPHVYYVMHYQNRMIWGATATILHTLALLVR